MNDDLSQISSSKGSHQNLARVQLNGLDTLCVHATDGSGRPILVPVRSVYYSRSKYRPHSGTQECARRFRQRTGREPLDGETYRPFCLDKWDEMYIYALEREIEAESGTEHEPAPSVPAGPGPEDTAE